MKAKVKAVSSEAKGVSRHHWRLAIYRCHDLGFDCQPFLYGATIYDGPLGNLWLGVAAFMMTTGVLVMRKMIQFDY